MAQSTRWAPLWRRLESLVERYAPTDTPADNVDARQPPDPETSEPSQQLIDAMQLERIMQTRAELQATEPDAAWKPRHLVGLSVGGLSPVRATVPVSMTTGSTRDIDPWWHADPVQRHYGDDELTEDRRIGNSTRYLVRTETRDIELLDGTKLQAIRNIFYDKKLRVHSKEILARDESGKTYEFNDVPKNLMQLDGIDQVEIGPTTDVVVVEGYPAAETLRSRGFDAVAVISGTFETPSERTLAPLLNAKHIVLWPDNDSAGAHLMGSVARALHRMGASDDQIQLVFWKGGPRKGDAYDFPGDDAELRSLLDDRTTWTPELRFVTNRIQRLRTTPAAAQLRLDPHLKPPTPELKTKPDHGSIEPIQ